MRYPSFQNLMAKHVPSIVLLAAVVLAGLASVQLP
jgi:hypothetical protein